VPNFTEVHIEFLFTVMDRLVLVEGCLLGGVLALQCCIISGEGVTSVKTLHGKGGCSKAGSFCYMWMAPVWLYGASVTPLAEIQTVTSAMRPSQ